MDTNNQFFSDEKRFNLIKRAISSDLGWQALAKTILASSNSNTKIGVLDILKQIAGDTQIVTSTPDGEVNTNFYDSLVNQLEYYIGLVKVIGEKLNVSDI